MAIDLYSPCPGGQGRKIKFCCADLAGELDRVLRMLGGEQYVACLDALDRCLVKHPGRACLMSLRAGLLRDLGQGSVSDAAAEEFLALHPDNYVACGLAAAVAAKRGETRTAVELSQRAIASLRREDAASEQIALITLIETSQHLVGEGDFAASLALMGWVLRTFPESEDALRALERILAAPGLSLLDRAEWELPRAQGDALWQVEFDAAVERANRGLAWSAEEALTALAERAPDAPEVWKALAILRRRLVDYAGSAEAWRRFAKLAASGDDAVEAVAVAQWIDPRAREADLDQVHVKVDVTDAERAEELMASDRRFARYDDPASPPVGADDEPMPRSVWRILDRPLLRAGERMSIDNASRPLGSMFLFGKQTRRPARIELQGRRDLVQQALSILRDVLSAFLSPLEDVQVLGTVRQLEALLFGIVEPPSEASDAEVEAVEAQIMRRQILEVLPRTPLAVLGGATLTDAARDPARRVEAAAALVLGETLVDSDSQLAMLAQLREQLGLLPAALLTLPLEAVWLTPLHQFLRLDVKAASTEVLEAAIQMFSIGVSDLLAERFAREILRRDDASLAGKGRACIVLAKVDAAHRLEHLAAARELAVREGASTALWDLLTMRALIERGEIGPALQLAEDLIAKSQGDRDLLGQIAAVFSQSGVSVDEIQRYAMQSSGGLAVSSSETKIWTPDSEVVAPKAGGLWIPGAD
jgi:tetratricopeptide (TPR) repeat protein